MKCVVYVYINYNNLWVVKLIRVCVKFIYNIKSFKSFYLIMIKYKRIFYWIQSLDLFVVGSVDKEVSQILYGY